LDEDTCATNFMIRDRRMQMLVAREDEPITPFLDRVRQLHEWLDVSTVLVMGGSGDYFEVAAPAIQLRAYGPREVTEEARQIAAAQTTDRCEEAPGNLERPQVRTVVAASLDPHTRPGKRRLQAHGVDTLSFGRDSIQLNAVEQIADPSQVRAIGLLLSRLGEQAGKVPDPPSWLRDVLATNNWYRLAYYPDGDLARPRVAEVMAALSRLRSAVFEP